MHRMGKWMAGSVLAMLTMVPVASPLMAQNRLYNGARNQRVYNDNYDRRRYHDRDQGGIGPGKGALIGAGGGAVLGAVLGGGLKGALVGGAAGAGIGAIAGKVNQDNNRRDRWGRPY